MAAHDREGHAFRDEIACAGKVNDSGGAVIALLPEGVERGEVDLERLGFASFEVDRLERGAAFLPHGQTIVFGDEEGEPRTPLVIVEDDAGSAGVGDGDMQVDPLVEKEIAAFGLGTDLNLGRDERGGGQKAERAEGGQVSHTVFDARGEAEENKVEFTVLA